METDEFVISDALVGVRVDSALTHFCQDLSLRGRRRLIARGHVLVNGKLARCGQHLAKNDRLRLVQPKATQALCTENPRIPVLAPVQEKDKDLIFFAKPRFLHSSSLAGSASISLEALVRPFLLLQRLDFATSGIVCAAKTAAAVDRVRALERAGGMCKKYCALLEGQVTEGALLSARLDTADRKKTRVCSDQGARLRQTLLVPFGAWARGEVLPSWLHLGVTNAPFDMSLVGCTLFLGARHQIRAHCAAHGHPLVGDSLYGAVQNIPSEAEGGFFLHQGAVFVGRTSCIFAPPWISQDAEQILAWLRARATPKILEQGPVT